MTYQELWRRLAAVYDEGEAKAVVRWVLDVAFGLSATDVYGGKVESLSDDEQRRLEGFMRRLEKAEPVQYVAGCADFCGRQFGVEPGVLIPRPETQLLCEWIMEDERQRTAGGHFALLDIGTGSGCIAITLALGMAGAAVSAWDISEQALRVARRNADKLGARVAFAQCDALTAASEAASQPTAAGAWDVIVSNPPYIDEITERAGMDSNVLDYEPREALFAPVGKPTLFYRRIGQYAAASLKPGGRLYFELNPLTAAEVADSLTALGFNELQLRDDQFGRQRFMKATWSR